VFSVVISKMKKPQNRTVFVISALFLKRVCERDFKGLETYGLYELTVTAV